MHEAREQDEDRGQTVSRLGRDVVAEQGDAVRDMMGGPPPPAGAAPDAPAGQGDAVRDMMGGPPPQGDVPDAPATQIAAADHEEGRGPRVRRVANAVPGKPDGEVDTRS